MRSGPHWRSIYCSLPVLYSCSLIAPLGSNARFVTLSLLPHARYTIRICLETPCRFESYCISASLSFVRLGVAIYLSDLLTSSDCGRSCPSNPS
ncbi:hypothetical protein F5Y03DRAFT_356032 [Xylaria venustula]|nr:hypothetical protein F5Y03DRAFT_356032 [Xylaria venustula]